MVNKANILQDLLLDRGRHVKASSTVNLMLTYENDNGTLGAVSFDIVFEGIGVINLISAFDMATNKNQHYVPRCYLRPFTIDSNNLAINLFNIDRRKFIQCVPVKHQCSSDYFYGENEHLENALQITERAYAATIREILKPGYVLMNSHSKLLKRFWLLQYMRTDAASRRYAEMIDDMNDVVGTEIDIKIGLKEAVQSAMRVFVDVMDRVDDLKMCLIRNRTPIEFVTSDDPAVLTNRWHLEDSRANWKSFGLKSAGSLLFLPISPKVMCIGYDNDVYHITSKHGWADVRDEMEINSLNQHQYLNCRANIFVHNAAQSKTVDDDFSKFSTFRPEAKHKLTYAVLDRREGEYARYRAIERHLADDKQEAIIHTQTVTARPSNWPKLLRWKRNGFVFTNGTGVGYIRKAGVELCPNQGFRKQPARRIPKRLKRFA